LRILKHFGETEFFWTSQSLKNSPKKYAFCQFKTLSCTIFGVRFNETENRAQKKTLTEKTLIFDYTGSPTAWRLSPFGLNLANLTCKTNIFFEICFLVSIYIVDEKVRVPDPYSGARTTPKLRNIIFRNHKNCNFSQVILTSWNDFFHNNMQIQLLQRHTNAPKKKFQKISMRFGLMKFWKMVISWKLHIFSKKIKKCSNFYQN